MGHVRNFSGALTATLFCCNHMKNAACGPTALSDIDFKDFMNLYKKCTAKPYSFLVIDANLASDNPSRFRKDLLERI